MREIKHSKFSSQLNSLSIICKRSLFLSLVRSKINALLEVRNVNLPGSFLALVGNNPKEAAVRFSFVNFISSIFKMGSFSEIGFSIIQSVPVYMINLFAFRKAQNEVMKNQYPPFAWADSMRVRPEISGAVLFCNTTKRPSEVLNSRIIFFVDKTNKLFAFRKHLYSKSFIINFNVVIWAMFKLLHTGGNDKFFINRQARVRA